ncbi:MAG: hypothetical protein KBT82_07720, partial [Marinobacter sp.]|uniref:hypothetical protein n=1 Tax=Marinobacter sp. TaxID=50741 RepID=UPI001B47B53C
TSRASSNTGGFRCLLFTRLSLRVRLFLLQNRATYSKKACFEQLETVYKMYLAHVPQLSGNPGCASILPHPFISGRANARPRATGEHPS